MNISSVNHTAYTTPQAKPKTTQAEISPEKTPSHDTFVKRTSTEEITYSRPTKLSAEQISSMKQQVEESMLAMAKKMLGSQAAIAKDETGAIDFTALAQQLGMGTTPETAAEAISENGAWGVEAVSTRLMDMAMSLSGGDPAMIETLREAVQKGFAAVGDLDSLPQVCQDTYHETMNRFDYWAEHGSLSGYGEETDENTTES